MNLSVVIPAHNEADNLPSLVQEIEHALTEGGEEFETIVVDDGSSDSTRAVLVDLAERYPRLRVLRHARACGQSTAVYNGVKAARYPWIGTLDGDGQNDPADLPTMMTALGKLKAETGKEAVIVGHRVQRHDTLITRWSSKIANGLRSRLLKDETPDTGCGIKIFPRDAFLDLPYFDHMHRFLPALFRMAGYAVHSVPVNHRPRTAGVSKYGIGNRLWAGLVDMAGVMWLASRYRKPDQVEQWPRPKNDETDL